MFGAGFLGQARFFSSDAAAATPRLRRRAGRSPLRRRRRAVRAAREGIMASQSGKSEQADAMATWDVALETNFLWPVGVVSTCNLVSSSVMMVVNC